MVKFVKILATALRTGVVTAKYPYEKPLVTDSFRGAVEVDPSKCIGCGACTQVCPPKALSLIIEDDVIILRYFVGRCTFCGVCAEICPENAIQITRNFEFATYSLRDLYIDIEHATKTCSMCGRPYTTVRVISKVREMSFTLSSKTYDLCPDCRMKRTAIKLLKFRA